jgi:hypothetical protein
MCDCRSYETARNGETCPRMVRQRRHVGFIAGICVVFWGAVILGIGWPLAQAIVGPLKFTRSAEALPPSSSGRLAQSPQVAGATRNATKEPLAPRAPLQ